MRPSKARTVSGSEWTAACESKRKDVWRLPRTKVKKLKQLGIDHGEAMALGNTRKGAWRISRTPTLNFALPLSLFVRRKGLLLLG